MSVDLFGDPVTDQDKPKPPARLAGYPATPGSGPTGESCRTCEHRAVVTGAARNYQKCALMRPHWTRGGGTDIKAGSPACSRYSKEGGAS